MWEIFHVLGDSPWEPDRPLVLTTSILSSDSTEDLVSEVLLSGAAATIYNDLFSLVSFVILNLSSVDIYKFKKRISSWTSLADTRVSGEPRRYKILNKDHSDENHIAYKGARVQASKKTHRTKRKILLMWLCFNS